MEHFGLSSTINTSYVKLQSLSTISKLEEVERIYINSTNIKPRNLQKRKDKATLEKFTVNKLYII